MGSLVSATYSTRFGCDSGCCSNWGGTGGSADDVLVVLPFEDRKPPRLLLRRLLGSEVEPWSTPFVDAGRGICRTHWSGALEEEDEAEVDAAAAVSPPRSPKPQAVRRDKNVEC